MTTIYWDFVDASKTGALDLTYYEPELVLPNIMRHRDGEYLKCPAFSDHFKNIYLIRSPVDIKIIFKKEENGNGFLTIEPQNQVFFNSYIQPRGNQAGKDDPFLMSIYFTYLFVADDDCLLEQMPAIFYGDEILNKIRLIPGSFNIHRWYRVLDFAFEVKDISQPLIINRGDPLFYIRFNAGLNKKVTLKNKKFDEDVYEALKSCINTKIGSPNKALNFLYKLAERVKPKIIQKKCPFNFKN
jgi:hypothetical protein